MPRRSGNCSACICLNFNCTKFLQPVSHVSFYKQPCVFLVSFTLLMTWRVRSLTFAGFRWQSLRVTNTNTPDAGYEGWISQLRQQWQVAYR